MLLLSKRGLLDYPHEETTLEVGPVMEDRNPEMSSPSMSETIVTSSHLVDEKARAFERADLPRRERREPSARAAPRPTVTLSVGSSSTRSSGMWTPSFWRPSR